MRKIRKKKYLMLILIIFAIGTGYAYLSSSLNIKGALTTYGYKLDVRFENVKVDENYTGNMPTISSDGLTVTYEPVFNDIGDEYSFYVDVANNGNLDAMIADIGNVIESSDGSIAPTYLDIKVKYADGYEVKKKNLLKKDSKKTLLINVKVNEMSDEEIPSKQTTYYASLKLRFVRADENAFAAEDEPGVCIANFDYEDLITEDTMCIRAKQLHVIERDSDYCASSGSGYSDESLDYQVYGNCGGEYGEDTLTAGDAFICDVNADGDFNNETEMFYYVSDYFEGSRHQDGHFNNTVASLIYYKDMKTDTYGSWGNNNLYGGRLLSFYQDIFKYKANYRWTLAYMIQPFNELGGRETLAGTIGDYTLHSSNSGRILTYIELKQYCDETTWKCDFLFENTPYFDSSIQGDSTLMALDTPYSESATDIFAIDQTTREIITSDGSYSGGVKYNYRPVIDVPKDKILYHH